MEKQRRVSPLTREKARERMLALPEEELAARVEKMQEGRKRARARKPERLAEVEQRMDELAVELAETPIGQRWAVRKQLRDLGQERLKLKWAE